MADLRLLYHDLIRYETELWNAIDTTLRVRHDLPITWFEILNLLSRTGGCRVQDMAQEFAITVGGVSKVVDRIEKAGYCIRRSHPTDRRSSIVELTGTGRQTLDSAMQDFDAELERRIGAVGTDAELTQLSATLAKLRAAGRGQDHEPGLSAKPGSSA